MASAQVTVKVAPFELQVITAGLELLEGIAKAKAHGTAVEVEVDWDLFERNPRQAIMAAQKIRTDLGLH